jgi:hypothetical protein
LLWRICVISICFTLGIIPTMYTRGFLASPGHYSKLDQFQKLSEKKPSLHTRSFRLRALPSKDGDSNGQEASTTSQPEPLQWAPMGPSPTAKPLPRPVKTRSGIPMFIAPIPEGELCTECKGTGKLTCGACKGKGRLNCRRAAMLPSGVWPQWCPHCRASGRWVCSTCMGTGERREPMGFRIE